MVYESIEHCPQHLKRSADGLEVWTELAAVSNTLGSAVFTDLTSNLSPQRFDSALLQSLPRNMAESKKMETLIQPSMRLKVAAHAEKIKATQLTDRRKANKCTTKKTWLV